MVVYGIAIATLVVIVMSTSLPLEWTSTLIQLQEWPLSLSPSIDDRMVDF